VVLSYDGIIKLQLMEFPSLDKQKSSSDLWTLSEGDSELKRKWVSVSMATAYELSKRIFPNAQVLIWGIRGYGSISKSD